MSLKKERDRLKDALMREGKGTSVVTVPSLELFLKSLKVKS